MLPSPPCTFDQWLYSSAKCYRFRDAEWRKKYSAAVPESIKVTVSGHVIKDNGSPDCIIDEKFEIRQDLVPCRCMTESEGRSIVFDQ